MAASMARDPTRSTSKPVVPRQTCSQLRQKLRPSKHRREGPMYDDPAERCSFPTAGRLLARPDDSRCLAGPVLGSRPGKKSNSNMKRVQRSSYVQAQPRHNQATAFSLLLRASIVIKTALDTKQWAMHDSSPPRVTASFGQLFGSSRLTGLVEFQSRSLAQTSGCKLRHPCGWQLSG